MAKLIKERPTEPISYLMKLLQKVLIRRKGSRGSSTLPLQLSGKSSGQMWLVAGKAETAMQSQEDHAIPLKASRKMKGNSLENSKEMAQTELPSWNTSVKPAAKPANDGVKNNADGVNAKKDRSKILKSSLKESRNTGKLSVNEKENVTPVGSSSCHNQSQLNDDEELTTQPVVGKHQSNNKITISSPQLYSKFKRKIARKKSVEKKEKLQSLLSKETSNEMLSGDVRVNNEDSDYEGEHVYEDVAELQEEGARTDTSEGTPKKFLTSSSTSSSSSSSMGNIKVTVCGRCAKVSESSMFNQQQQPHSSANMFSDSDDSPRSIASQTDQNETYEITAWSPSPLLSPLSEHGDKNKMAAWCPSPLLSPSSDHNEVLDSRGDSGALDLVTSSRHDHVEDQNIKDEDNDFFERNNPHRNKVKKIEAPDESGRKSVDVIVESEASDVVGSDRSSGGTVGTGKGWEVKEYESDIMSDA